MTDILAASPRYALTEPVDLLIRNAAEVLTCRGPASGVVGQTLEHAETIGEGAIAVRGDRIVAVGTTHDLATRFTAKRTIDAEGQLVSPGLIDPHSHLLFGGTRHDEYEAKVTGLGPRPGLERGIHS